MGYYNPQSNLSFSNVPKNEDKVTTAVERQTAKIPSIGFLGLAVGSMAASLGFLLADKKHIANFIGQWAPTILIMGLYNKVVKIEEEMLAQQKSRSFVR